MIPPGSQLSRSLLLALFSSNANVFNRELLKLCLLCPTPHHRKEEEKEKTLSYLPFCLRRLLSRARRVPPIAKPVAEATAPPK